MEKTKRTYEDNSDRQEHVSVFGKPVEQYERQWGKHHQGSAFGFMLIAAGIILLLNTNGLLPWTIWENIRNLWPFLLIIWGIEIMLGGSLVGFGISQILTFTVVALVTLFAINQVNPQLLSGLPPIFSQIFGFMKGITQ